MRPGRRDACEMIAWDKTAAQGIALPDDIWTIGDSKEALFRMDQLTTRQSRIQLSDIRSESAAIAGITTDTLEIGRTTGREEAPASLHPTTQPLPLRLVRMIIGHPGAVAIAGLSVLAVAAISTVESADLIEMLVGTIALRILCIVIRTTGISHEHGLHRLCTKQMWRDEAAFAAVFCTAAFLFDWRIQPIQAILFLTTNVGAQVAVHVVGKRLLKSRETKKVITRASRALIIGTGVKAKHIVDVLLDNPEVDMHPSGFLDNERTGLWRYRDVPLVGRLEDIDELALKEQVDAVFIATGTLEPEMKAKLLYSAGKMGITVHLFPGDGLPSTTLETARLNGFPTLVYRATSYRYPMMVMKRAADVLGGLIMLLFAAPIMLATAIAIKVGSRGPILFRQIRSGRNGRRFMLYKFRTMTCDAEEKKASLLHCNEMSGPVFKIKDDPRVTRVGKYLRKYSVDELPQLFNVLAGEMSLVGPRPPLPMEVKGYEPWQRRKLSVRPGLTCLWQVNGRNAIDFSDWMRLDLEYIDNWSFTLDMKILARTIPTVLKGSGV